MKEICIYTTSGGYRIALDKHTSLITGTDISLQDFYAPFIEIVYNVWLKQYIVKNKYRYYDGQYLYMPIYDLPRLLDFLKNKCKVKLIPIAPIEGKDIDLDLIDGFTYKDTYQKNAVDQLVQSPNTRRFLSLPTGKGKTVVSICTCAAIKKRALITMTSIMDQWKASFLKFTKIKEDEIYILQGRKSVELLLEEIDTTLFPKVILGNIPTLVSYQKDIDQIDPNIFNNFCEKLGIGIRFVDEVHQRFAANFAMDVRWNTKIFVAISATFERTDPLMNSIFQQMYGGEEKRVGEDIKTDHIEVRAFEYHLAPNILNMIPKHKFSTFLGYSHMMFEKFMCKRDYIYKFYTEKVILPILRDIYFNNREEDERLLVLFSTQTLRDKLVATLKKEYPKLKTIAYTQKMNIEETHDADIIVSTTKKAGTASDFPNLKATYVGVSISSKVDNKQNLGRLRELKNKTPIFAYSVCLDIPATIKHGNIRKHIFKDITKSIETRRI